MGKKRKVICQLCQSDRVTWKDGDPFIDDKRAAKVHVPPSRAVQCDECGDKCTHFITDKHPSLNAIQFPKDFKFKGPIGGVMVGKSNQRIFVCPVGDYTLVHVVAKAGDNPISTYGLRKGKTWVTDGDIPKERFVEDINKKGYFFERDEEGNIQIIFKRRGLIKSIKDVISN